MSTGKSKCLFIYVLSKNKMFVTVQHYVNYEIFHEYIQCKNGLFAVSLPLIFSKTEYSDSQGHSE